MGGGLLIFHSFRVGGLVTVWWLVLSVDAAVLLALTTAFSLQTATSDFLPQLRSEPEGEGGRW